MEQQERVLTLKLLAKCQLVYSSVAALQMLEHLSKCQGLNRNDKRGQWIFDSSCLCYWVIDTRPMTCTVGVCVGFQCQTEGIAAERMANLTKWNLCLPSADWKVTGDHRSAVFRVCKEVCPFQQLDGRSHGRLTRHVHCSFYWGGPGRPSPNTSSY